LFEVGGLKVAIHPEGWPFIAIAVALTALLFVFAPVMGWLFVPVTLWCIAFFRDPERATPDGAGLIICPADGKLLAFATASPPAELGMGDAPRLRLSIFMDVFNVHVNRMPHDGTVEALSYRPGKFFNASFDKASEQNERMSVRIKLTQGGELAVVQIAGLIARRIVCNLVEGQQVRRGERFGIIRFGSRVDVYLPQGAQTRAKPGDKVRAGETVLAVLAGIG
jgi:phosphatidylserine decarboxylase